ncbi:MAG TPA: hypothetical protein VLI06_08500 [Solimonas sp.]|nr:hypothetical protein [Solimonas sp.]
MKVGIQIKRGLNLPLPYERVAPVLKDLEGTIRRFPKLRKLTKLKKNAYLWEMKSIGSKIPNIAHEVIYAAQYEIDTAKGELSWTALPKHGNATIEGRLRLKDLGKETRLIVEMEGELRDVPVPLMYRLVAAPFIQGRFTYLVDAFLQRTADAVLAEPARGAGSR